MSLPDLSQFSLPAMDDSNMMLVVLAVLLSAIFIFSIIKGAIRMILLAVAIISALGVWLLIQRNGFTFLSFMTSSPEPWMVQAAAWTAAVFVLMVFYHGMSWLSQLFSWRKGFTAAGILTTVLMSALMLWLAAIGLSYYGNVSRIGYYHELAKAYVKGEAQPNIPWAMSMKNSLRKAASTAWLESIDPMENLAQANLACLVAYGCSLDEAGYRAFYEERLANRGIPHPPRFLDLFGDKGLRRLVEEGRFSTLFENERLTTFLQFANTQEHLLNIL